MKKEIRPNPQSNEQSIEEMSFDIVELDDEALASALGGSTPIGANNCDCANNCRCPV